MDRVIENAKEYGFNNEFPVYKEERYFNECVGSLKQDIVDATHPTVWPILADLIREMRQYYSYQLALKDEEQKTLKDSFSRMCVRYSDLQKIAQKFMGVNNG